MREDCEFWMLEIIEFDNNFQYSFREKNKGNRYYWKLVWVFKINYFRLCLFFILLEQVDLKNAVDRIFEL